MVNTLVICKKCYNSEKEFYEEIKETIKVLLNNEYIMTVRYDEKNLGIVVIEYDSMNLALGGLYPYWLTEDQMLGVEVENEV